MPILTSATCGLQLVQRDCRVHVEVADRLSQMLLAGQTACLARRLQALEAIGEGQAPGSEEERRRASEHGCICVSSVGMSVGA
eukprot:1159774-Pelagomonas_calceolata.AAC.6